MFEPKGRVGGAVFGLAILATGLPAAAEPFTLPECDGVRGVGVVVYAKTERAIVSSTSELSEICWNEDAATFTASEASRDLELVSRQGTSLRYQRLDGGTVSALNEQLEIGPWEAHQDGTFSYLRWTTESSRTPEELNGYDFVTTEGFLVGDAGFTPRPESAVYKVQMVLTGVGGSLTSMVYNLFLPVQGDVTVEGDALRISMTDFQKGMLVGELTFDMDLTETDVGFDGTGKIVMENELLAGGPDVMWKHLELTLEEIFPVYSGADVAFVATLVGEMESFGGDRAPVRFSLVGSGRQ